MEKNEATILCVDDDPDTCEMLTLLLGLAGYEVMATGSIAEGVYFAMTRTVGLILLDWVLKDGTGVELCKELRSTGVTAPILFYTGKNITNELLGDALRAGAQGFLTKPVDANTILQSVSAFIGQPKLNQ